jgi:hypothetical protein
MDYRRAAAHIDGRDADAPPRSAMAHQRAVAHVNVGVTAVGSVGAASSVAPCSSHWADYTATRATTSTTVDTAIRVALHCHDLHLRAAAATSTNYTTYVLPIHHHEAADDGGVARRSRLGGNRDGQDVGAYDVPTLKKDS